LATALSWMTLYSREQYEYHMSYIKNRILSFRFAFRGITTLFRETPNAVLQLIAAALAVALGVFLHISRGEWLALVIIIGGVLAMEALNSALEVLSDYVCRNEIHPSIGKVKDLTAAAVLIAALASLAVGILIFLPKIILLFS